MSYYLLYPRTSLPNQRSEQQFYSWQFRSKHLYGGSSSQEDDKSRDVKEELKGTAER